jgi:hypothetical protein
VLLFLAVALSSYDTFRRNGEIRGMWPRYVYGAVPVLAVGVTATIASVGDRLRRMPRWAVASVVATFVGAGIGLSFFEAMRGVYDTSSLSVMIDRAGIVAPVPHPARWLVAIGLLWLVTLVAASWEVAECWVRRAESRAVVRDVRIPLPQPSSVASESPGDLKALRWTMANHTTSNNNSHARQATATAAASPRG